MILVVLVGSEGFQRPEVPAKYVQMDLVEGMAVARWRLRRIWAIETSLLANDLQHRAEDMADEFTEMSCEDRLAWIF